MFNIYIELYNYDRYMPCNIEKKNLMPFQIKIDVLSKDFLFFFPFLHFFTTYIALLKYGL